MLAYVKYYSYFYNYNKDTHESRQTSQGGDSLQDNNPCQRRTSLRIHQDQLHYRGGQEGESA